MAKQIYELIGVKVKEKLSKITYAGTYAGKIGYHLMVEVDDRPEIKKIYAYQDSVGLTGSVDIEESNYADQRYLFYCHLNDRKYYLIGWKELNNNSSLK
ncbi:20250_t:CDS:2 [Gigaspora margarita]|uniref:20250_t:CDS:1 n=1 Tax=Gigaspora margarita TaxID=4874 RepID=A0ABN7WR06_GIGMA|nr:20250_t:CDS:2 [Gigaspora margarita]